MLSSFVIPSSLLVSAMSMPLTARQTTETINTGLISVRSVSPIRFRTIQRNLKRILNLQGHNDILLLQFSQASIQLTQRNRRFVLPASQPISAIHVRQPSQRTKRPRGTTRTISFTSGHEEYTFPNGSYTSGFVCTTNENKVSFLTFTNGSATSWFACPASETKPTQYKVFADVEGFCYEAVPTGRTEDCLAFGMLVANKDDSDRDIAAWQYV